MLKFLKKLCYNFFVLCLSYRSLLNDLIPFLQKKITKLLLKLNVILNSLIASFCFLGLTIKRKIKSTYLYILNAFDSHSDLQADKMDLIEKKETPVVPPKKEDEIWYIIIIILSTMRSIYLLFGESDKEFDNEATTMWNMDEKININTNFFKNNSIAKGDANYDNGFFASDTASIGAESINYFQESYFLFILIIGFFVTLVYGKVLFISVCGSTRKSVSLFNSASLEFLWTFIPAFFLVISSIPAYTVLYGGEIRYNAPKMTIKVLGHQWFWSYEFPEFFVFENYNNSQSGTYSLYMDPLYNQLNGSFRLLETSPWGLILPTEVEIRFFITSVDVLHSWSLPSLGIKLDACPGRLSEVSSFIKRPSTFFGQCSEICGANHGFMPIHVFSMNYENYEFFKVLEIDFVDTEIFLFVKTNNLTKEI